MAKKTHINLGGESFVAELQDIPVNNKNGFDVGLLFTIHDKKGETIGCLSTFLSMTTKVIWKNHGELTPEVVENLFLRILPHVPFAISISDFSAIYPECIPLFVHTSDTYYDEKHKTQYVRAQENPYALINNLVFNGNIDDDQVQRDVLNYLYAKHLENRHSFEDTIHIAKSLFIDEDTVFRCLDYLEDDGYIQGDRPSGTPGIYHPKITTNGVRYVRNNFQQIHSGKEVVVMGDYIGNDKITTNIQGDSNQNIVKSTVSNSFNMNLVHQNVDNLIEKIEQEYKGVDKKVLIEQVEEIKTLATEKQNFSKIREVLGRLMTKTAEFATIGTACIEVFKLFAGGS